jgi:ABC-type methionine transport system ATPase subunit
VLNGGISLGTMLAAAAMAAGFLEPLATLVQTGLKLQLLRSYMERINDVLDAPAEQEGQTVATAPRLTGRIRAEGVSFAYGGPLAPLVVKDVSLEVQPGELLGIVGRSGSGKSTFAHLLLGLYLPTSGRILFDGRELTELDFRSLRGQIGIVTQRPYLFGATIRQNIALSNPAMPHQAVVDAAKLACIHDEIVAMPMGYDTPLVDAGASLSGGQQQRIALARALAHRPTVLLLDEATSDLDAVTERMVHRNLRALGCTRIVIAHRLSTIVDADTILVLDQGKIVEHGKHDELVRRDGHYARLVRHQLEHGDGTAWPDPGDRFPVVTDGYDREAVDRRLAELDIEITEARRRAAMAAAALARVRGELFDQQGRSSGPADTIASSPEDPLYARDVADFLTREGRARADAMLAAATTRAAEAAAAADQRATGILDAATDRAERMRAEAAERRAAAEEAAAALRAQVVKDVSAVLTEARERVGEVWESARLEQADLQEELERLRRLRDELRDGLTEASAVLRAVSGALGGCGGGDSPSAGGGERRGSEAASEDQNHDEEQNHERDGDGALGRRGGSLADALRRPGKAEEVP